MKIGILYLCTGKYTVFWPEFYKNFEKNFLPGCPKTYLVFTDAPQIAHETKPNVRRIEQEALPWPYSTMERFRIFLTREQELREFDYLFYANANLECRGPIQPGEFLPRGGQETLVAVCHLPYYGKPPRFHPYDRNPRSRACIPYNCGQYYVAGGLNGGQAGSYLALCRELARRTQEDLDHGVIARQHDESQLNRMVAEHPEWFRILGPEFCVPEETPVPNERIRVLQKNRFLDVSAVKGRSTPKNFIQRTWEAFRLNWMPYLWWARDTLLHKTLK